MAHRPDLPDSPPLVSIVVRTRDRPRLLGRALASLSAQSHRPLQVVVVNDGGTDVDAVCATVRPALTDLKLINHGLPRGRSAAANAGFEAVDGALVGLLDDDDWFESDHVALLVQALQEHTARVAYAGVRCVVDDDGANGGFREILVYNQPFDLLWLRCENYIPVHAALFERALLEQGAAMDETMDLFEDWDFWLQLAEHGTFHHEPRITASYFISGQGSGLYGNAQLQRQAAERIYAKWSPGWDAGAWSDLWQCARERWQTERRALALDGQLEDARRDHARIHAELQALAGTLAERDLTIVSLQSDLSRTRSQLQGTHREYDGAMALLRREQFTVFRPLARHARRLLRGGWRQLPPAWRSALREQVLPAGRRLAPAVVDDDDILAAWIDRLSASGSGAGFDVIVFPVIDWHFRFQRPQHLARKLADRGHRVLYLSTTFYRSAAAAGLRFLENPHPNVFLAELGLPDSGPNLYRDTLDPDRVRALSEVLLRLYARSGLGRLVSIVDLPFWRPLAVALPANLVVYDCMDYHAGFSTNTGEMLREEERMLEQCDLLLTSSARLEAMIAARVPDKPQALIRNGAEVDFFAATPEHLALQSKRPVVGYFGAISAWFDLDLVSAAARARPHWDFVLIGSTFGCDLAPARGIGNLRFVDEVPYATLPGWLHGLDVCMIPFRLNELTACTNPVKVYEYLSAGKPVVATRLPELELISDQLHLADDAPGFLQALDAAMAERDDRALADRRQAWAGQHGWDRRAEELEAAVARCYPPVSVVVLCFNNLELTQACLESVERCSHWPNLELVVVDNGSSDGTPSFLQYFAAGRPWVKLVLNPVNRGFAAGNNAGLTAATGEYLVLLNNDTVVSPGWIQGLVRHLQAHPELAMVGPVTNNIGNEARVELDYAALADMPGAAMRHSAAHARELFPCRVLAFFCVAMRRAVYERIGGLDEAFGVGFFEDDDYCNRVREQGWQMAIADDVFIHHHLSATFDAMKRAERDALFERNRQLYERKWGPWVPHSYR